MIGAKPCVTWSEGFRIDSRRYASSAVAVCPLVSVSFDPYTLARLGPRESARPLWHALQLRLANSLSPFCARDMPLVDSASHRLKSSGVITTMSPIIAEWLVPQYCVQNR